VKWAYVWSHREGKNDEAERFVAMVEMFQMFKTLKWGVIVLLVFLTAAAFTKNKSYSSALATVGFISFLLFFLGGCFRLEQAFSDIH
jgi:hypothetical protein